MGHSVLLYAVVFLFLGCAASCSTPQENGTGSAAAADSRKNEEHGGGMPDRFENPEEWSARWDTAERDAWQQPEKVIEFLGLRGGETVADIGAGTGYFSLRLARAVGPSGRVLAVDIDPEMLEFVAERARRKGLSQVETVQAGEDDPRLPEGAVDLILTVNTWHHIDDRVDYMRGLASSLAPDGRVVIVDFRKGDLPVGPPDHHKISAEDLIEEARRAGFELAGALPDLQHQYVMEFRPSKR